MCPAQGGRRETCPRRAPSRVLRASRLRLTVAAQLVEGAARDSYVRILLPRIRGKRFGVRWYENGRRRFKTYATRELAEQVLAKIVSEMAVDDAGLRRDYDESPDLEALAKAWLERRLKTHRAAKDDGY